MYHTAFKNSEMNILTRNPGRIVTLASILAYALVLLYGAIFAFVHPVSNWDTLAYMDLVLISEGQTAQSAHAAVYQAIRGTERAGLATDTAWDEAMAASPELFTERLPFSTSKSGTYF